LEKSVNKVSFIEGSVFPLESALTVLFSFVKFSFECCFSLVPTFKSSSMLHIIQPISFIFGSLSINKGTKSIGHVCGPITLINITIRVSHASTAMGFISRPLSLIHRAIRPELYSTPVPLVSLLIPLPLVFFPILHINKMVNVDAFNTIHLKLPDFFL